MAKATRELNSIPFGHLIGGPLDAAVQAQSKAAMTTVDFIKAVGFEGDGKDTKVANVEFKVVKGQDTTTIQVPLLTIVPIPFLRVDDMTIDFKANITQSQEDKDSTSATKQWGVKADASASWLWGKASMSANYSSKKDSTSTKDSKYSVEHTVDVNVHAVQDDVPGGLSKILNILTNSIEEPSGSTQPEPKEKPEKP